MIGCLNILSFFQSLVKASQPRPGAAESESASTATTTTRAPRVQAKMTTTEGKPRLVSTASTEGTSSTVATSSAEATSSSFPLFSKLPANVRIKIWKMANSHPRIIMVEEYHVSSDKSVRPPSHPSTLAVNFESRNEAKKAYDMIFEPRLGHPVAFNYAIDTLFLENYDVTWYFHGPAHQRYNVDHRAPVRSLALDILRTSLVREESGEVDISRDDITYIIQIIKWFPGIRDLFIVPRHELKGMMKLAEESLERMLYRQLRKLRRTCCILHEAECDCTLWRFPKVHFMTLPQMKEYLGAEVHNINDEYFGKYEDDDALLAILQRSEMSKS